MNSIMITLKKLLAEELFLDEELIEEEAQFLDLGLDSITGTTWVKKVNQECKINITATKIYSYPTLAELVPYVMKEMERNMDAQKDVIYSETLQDDVQYERKEEVRSSIKLNNLEEEGLGTKEACFSISSEKTLPSQIMRALKKLLSEELFMDEELIEEDVQFLELGLDSITGVTWVKSINKLYQINIPATQIYSHPTLAELVPYVTAEIERNGQQAIDTIKNKIETTTLATEKKQASVIKSDDVQQTSPVSSHEKNANTGSASLHEPSLSSVISTLKKLLAEELFLAEESIEDDAPFLDLGLDSITGVTWVKKINQAYQIDMPATQIYSLPTLFELAPYVSELLEKEGEIAVHTAHEVLAQQPQAQIRIENLASTTTLEEGNSLSHRVPESTAEGDASLSTIKSKQRGSRKETSFEKNQAIAIIGMAGKFPQAKSIEEYWENIESGKNCISEIPKNRWDINEYYDPESKTPGTIDCKWMGAIEEYDLFDASFFNISDREAESMDPQQRLFLEACWHSIEDSGYNPMTLSGSRCGVFVGCGPGDYSHLLHDSGLTEHGLMGGSTSVLAARISYFLNLQGPCLAIDTACSSSLVAIANACDSLTTGRSDLALAGGVCVMSGPALHIMTSNAGMLSKSGRCFSFDQRADGFVPSEGVGVVFLKRLEDAQEDGDLIHGVIQGWGVNQDGKTNGITAPNPKAQTRLQTEIYDKFSINPEQIQLIEAHGTGTKLGDAIEIEGIKESFGNYTRKKQYCALGSVKSNIGHSLHASGVLGAIKLLMALKHKKLPPTINFDMHNEHVDIDGSPFYINTTCKDWAEPVHGSRQAAISSFGLNGTNAHLVISESPTLSRKLDGADHSLNNQVIVSLSAKTAAQLTVYAHSLLKVIKNNPDFSLRDLAYTLQIGRTAMNYRMAAVVDSFDELKLALQSYVQGRSHEKIMSGVKKHRSELIFNTQGGAEYIKNLTNNRKYKVLAELWVIGNDINWQGSYDLNSVRRLSGLPVYPFAKTRYWLPEQQTRDCSPNSTLDSVASTPSTSNNATLTAHKHNLGNQFSAEDKAELFLQQLISEQLLTPVGQIDSEMSFYEMGMMSHHLLKIAHSIKSKIAESFSPTVLYECPTTSDLVSYLVKNYSKELERLEIAKNQCAAEGTAVKDLQITTQDEANSQSSARVPSMICNLAERYEPFPLNDIQESFFIGRKLSVDKVGCHVYFEMEVTDLDINRLNNAWNSLNTHHEMLRAVMLPNGQQRILERTPSYQFTVADLKGKNDSEQLECLYSFREKMSHKVYEPTQWPLYEICISVCDDKQVIHFSIDELITDACGIQLLIQQWGKLYEYPNWKLPQLDMSFRDYIVAIKTFENSEYYKRDLEYWVNKLEHIPQGPSLPVKTTRDNAQYVRTSLEGSLEQAQWQALKAKLEELNVSPTVFLLSAFTETLRMWCNEELFSIVLTFFNRLLDRQLEQIVAPFISTNIFTVQGDKQCSFRQLIQDVQKELFEDLGHSSVSGIRALRELKKRRKISKPLSIPIVFTSLLGYDLYEDEGGFMDKISFSITQTPQVYFDHQIHEHNGALKFRWDVAKDHYAIGVIEQIFSDYCRTLELLASNFELWDMDGWNVAIKRNSLSEKLSLVQCDDAEVHPALRKVIAENLKLQHFPDKRLDKFPLTDQQQAYAFGRSKYGGNISSQFYTYFDVEHLNIDRLETAWHKVLETHEMLRTVIHPDGTQQVLKEIPTYKISVADLRGKQEGIIQDELSRTASSMVTRLCPVGEWPYFDIKISLIDGVKSRIHFSIDLIIADGPSIKLSLNTLFSFYQEPNQLPQIRQEKFSDYIFSLQQYKNTEGYKRSLQYWKNKFIDIPSGPDLPVIEGVTTHNTERLEGTLVNWSVLMQKARVLSISPGMVLLAVYAEVLAEWSQSDTFSIVIPSWDRLPIHPDINNIVGDFTSMSWLVVDKQRMTFVEKVRSYHEKVSEDLLNQAVSGLSVLRTVVTKRNQKKMLSFPVVFTNLSNSSSLQLPEGFKLGDSLSQTSQVHLDNMSSENNGQLNLYWDVAKEIFPVGMMQEMFNGYLNVLECLANDPQSWERIDFSDLINAQPEKYRAAISIDNSAKKITELGMANVTLQESSNVVQSSLLHQLIEQQVKQTPHAEAIRFEENSLSFSELNYRANQCGYHLRSLGVSPNDVVAVVMDRSLEMIIGLLGILKAGGAYLPLDPKTPKERLEFILQDANVSVILTQEKWVSLVEGYQGRVIALDRNNFSEQKTTNLTSVNQPDDLAYIIYTSGSTGKPKGCMLPHEAICNRLLWMREQYQVSNSDRILQKTPYTFDVSVWELFLPLLSGACLVFAKPAGHRDNSYLINLIQQEKVTICHFVPSMLRFFLNQKAASRCTSLKHVFASGEALPYELVDKFISTMPAKLHNLYGPTEAAVDVSYWECELRPDKKVPIGREISNVQLHVLNDQLVPVEQGDSGELYIGGICLAKGYLNRPELTIERFIDNPLIGVAEKSQKLYRTGDKARCLSDGNIEYLGRLDSQVKLRGFRIELGDIESKLNKHKYIDHSVVLVKDEGSVNPKLIAYVVTKIRINLKEIRDFLKTSLPDYMLPNAVVCINDIPVTVHGKIDHKALLMLSQITHETTRVEQSATEKNVNTFEF